MREADVATMVSSRLAATMGFAGGAEEIGAVRTKATRSPLRLTRRGRMAAAGVSALLVGALSMTLATAAQASRDGAARGGPAQAGQYVTKVTVRSGESLFSLAEAYDPGADPRAVVQQVLQLNSLPGDQVQPGEVLWVPRG
jgi:hypothetical protein